MSGDDRSDPFIVRCSVLQSLVLGPIEFVSYTEDVVELFNQHGLSHHLFANDKQLYTLSPPSFTLRLWPARMVHVAQAPTQFLQDGAYLVRLSILSQSTKTGTYPANRRNSRETDWRCPRPRCPAWQRADHGATCQQNGQHLLLPSTPASATPTSRGHGYHEADSTTVLQYSSVLATSINHRPFATSAECHCSGHTWFVTTWPCLSGAVGAAMAASCSLYAVQGCAAGNFNVYGTLQSLSHVSKWICSTSQQQPNM